MDALNPAQLDPKVVKVMSALKKIESGGDYNAVGDNGDSHGAYQFNKNNWTNWAQEYLGDANAPMTPANQNKLMYARIKQQKDSGLQPEEIAAIHNGAHKESDGKYAYNNPLYGDKFRAALGGNSGYNPKPFSNPSTPGQFDFTGATQESPDTSTLGGQISQRGQDISGAFNTAGTGVSEIAQGNVGRGLFDVGSGALQTVGGVAGGVGDVIGAGLGLIPGVKQGEELLGKGVSAVANTPLGQKITQGAQDFSQNNPVLSKDIGAAFNIGSLALGGIGAKVGKEAATQGLYNAAKEGVLGAGAKGVVERKALTQASELLGTNPTKAEVKSAIRGGRLSTSGVPGVIPDKLKQNSINAVAQMIKEGKLPKNALAAEKADLIRQEADNTAEQLAKDVEAQNFIIPKKEINARLNEAASAVEESPVLVGDASLVAKKLLNGARDIIGKNDGTGAGLLKARKEYDAWVQKFKPKVFNSSADSAFTLVNREIRDSLNKLLIEKAPNLAIKESLAKQSALYKALDYITPNVKSEIGTTRFGRFSKRHPVISGVLKKGVRYGAEGLGIGAGLHVLGD